MHLYSLDQTVLSTEKELVWCNAAQTGPAIKKDFYGMIHCNACQFKATKTAVRQQKLLVTTGLGNMNRIYYTKFKPPKN